MIGADVITGVARRALCVANAYLDLANPDHTKEHTPIGDAS